jgi:hypothetical protein
MSEPKKEITQFETGAIRDTQKDKPQFLECMSPFAMWRYGIYMEKASRKYGPDNWTKGIPKASYLESLERHLIKLKMEFKHGHVAEPGVDHAAAIMFNIMGFLHECEKPGATSTNCAGPDVPPTKPEQGQI